jgi:Probable cobalt transporter subunit (CbtA)
LTRTLLVRGLLVGLAAGVVAFIFAHFFGEPSVAAAIALEEAGHPHVAGEDELVSRGVQSTVGLLAALLGFGAAMGGLFGLAFAVAQGRVGRIGARATAGLIALVGFVTIYLVPFIKYPGNPPAVGNPDTIGRRTQLYFAMMVLSILAAVAAVWLARQIHRLSGWDRILVGVGIYLTLVTICMAILPAVNEVARDFPADTLWSFRAGSLLIQLAVWATLGVLYGALTARSERPSTGASPGHSSSSLMVSN